MSMVIERTTAGGRDLIQHSSWLQIKEACVALQGFQASDGSIAAAKNHSRARNALTALIEGIADLIPHFPHDEDYLQAVVADCRAWEAAGFGIPDFYESLSLFHPERTRVDGTPHLVVFPMYTQNGSTNRFFEAVLCETIWPEAVQMEPS